MEKNNVLQQLAEKIKDHFAIPENREAFTRASEQMRKLCTMVLGPEVRRAIYRNKLQSDVNKNLN